MVSLDLVAIHGAALDNYELFFLKNVTQASEKINIAAQSIKYRIIKQLIHS